MTEPKTSEGEQDPTIEEAPAETPKETDAEKATRLEKENDDLRAAQQPTPAVPSATAPKITAAQMRAMGPQQREQIEKQFNVPFDEIVREVETGELRNQNVELASRVNVRDALDDAQSSDPKVHTLKVHMKSYLERLPLEVRADPERLKQEIAHAKTYARGKQAEAGGGSPVPLRPTGRGGRMPQGMPNPNDTDPEPEMPEGTIESGVEFKSADGKFSFTVGVDGDRLSKEKRKQIAHPSDPNGCMFKREETPRFNRG